VWNGKREFDSKERAEAENIVELVDQIAENARASAAPARDG
jgi:hypothetical protein